MTGNWLRAVVAAALVIGLGTEARGAPLGPGGEQTASMLDYAATPPLIVEGADPLLLINLSVELTQQAEAFTDAKQTYANGLYCPGRTSWNSLSEVGGCFASSEEFIGYFDPDKCYTYDTSGNNRNPQQLATGPRSDSDPHYFRPVGPASGRECPGTGQFSGNFLNWATMTALDQFRSAMTGGARLIDTTGAGARTLLARTYRYDNWPFVRKVISSASSGNLSIRPGGQLFSNQPSRLTPWNVTAVRVDNDWGSSGHKVRFYNQNGAPLSVRKGSGRNAQDITEFNVIVQVCDPAVGLEENCVRYSDGSREWYKPEGLLQQNAMKMRYALTSYTARGGIDIDGGVLRSEAKYIGLLRPGVGGGMEVNPLREINEDGSYRFNPDGASLTRGVQNSGILNYINHFGLAAGRYKANDPVAELYYEGLRYLMGLQPTRRFYNPPGDPLTHADKDGYPVITSWTDDPIASSCQQSFALYVGDQFAHHDRYVPDMDCTSSDSQCKEALDMGLNARVWTNKVGVHEGFHGDRLAERTRGREDGFWIAGLAYWANTNDIRPDLDGFHRVKTFMVDTQEYSDNPPMARDNQLWLAAKYGGYDYDPEHPSHPDPSDLDDPEAYTLASQPANLRAGLSRAFEEVVQATSSASAAAVVNNSVAGSGVIYQALYEPRLSSGSTTVNWTGTVRGLFLDDQARFREDSNGNGRLDASDLVLEFYQDPVQDVSLVRRLTTDGTVVDEGVPVRDVRAIWDARRALAEQSAEQRLRYGSGSIHAGSGRWIYTWIDANGNGQVDPGEWRPFTAAEFNGSSGEVEHARLLGLGDSELDQAGDLVDYVRGQDQPQRGWRSRQFDLDGDGRPETLKLGDVVHSAPLAVGAPEANYNSLHRDRTYAAFQRRYAQRRQVIYAGGNDGMLHAFNGGFFRPAELGFATHAGGGEVQHPLGAELWAYVPYNLLPHLQWLKNLDYPHVYYVDGPPQAFDVNIFNDCPAGSESSCLHPHGWGTILVVGFRLGGGDLTVKVNGSGTERTFRSAYLVFDITDPEQPPELLTEITHPDLGYATGRPTVVKQRRPGSGGSYEQPAKNDWYLVFGSGPAGQDGSGKHRALTDAVSDQPARLFAWQLNAGQRGFVPLGSDGEPYQLVGDSNSFVGDLVAQDWDNDYQDDALYFGTVSGTVSNPGGGLWRAVIDDDFSLSISRVVDVTNQPFSSPPLVQRDSTEGRPWVLAGSGRFFTSQDIRSAGTMSFYGINEPRSDGELTWATVPRSALANTSQVQVFEGGTLRAADPLASPGIPGDAATLSQLQQEVRSRSGWYLDFPRAAERYIDRAAMVRNVVTFNSYVASGDSCRPAGESYRYDLGLYTGTASLQNTIGTDHSVLYNGSPLISRSQALGKGQFFLSGIVRSSDGSFKRINQSSSGELSGDDMGAGGQRNARLSWRELALPASLN